MTNVRVVGASGRVGSALARHLAVRFEVEPVNRKTGEPIEELAQRAATDASVVLNAAGVAHVSSDDERTRQLLHAGNVELPVALASTALETGAAFIHISSVKAETPDSSPYAASKRAGDDALESLGSEFAEAGLSVMVVRPLALLFPPLDAGKVRHLRFLRMLPAPLVPPIRLPVLAPGTFLSVVESVVDEILAGTAPPGFTVRRFDRHDRGTLRDVASSFKADSESTTSTVR